MNKKSYESHDIFEADDWIGDALDIQNKLGGITNPYRGNKRKMISDLARVFKEHDIDLTGGKALDLFAGSSFVSYFMKKQGAAVWSNDLLAFSYLGAVSLVESDRNYTSEEQIHDIIWNDAANAGTFMRDKYAGKRFTEEEAERLDVARHNLLKEYEGCLPEGKTGLADLIDCFSDHKLAFRNFGKLSEVSDSVIDDAHNFGQEVITILHYVMQKCDLGGRLNNGQVVAEVNHRLKRQKMSFNRISPYNMAFDNGLISVSTNLDAMDLLNLLKINPVDFDVVYIDPPYGGGQSDYANMYQIFEDFLGFDDKHSDKNKKRFTKSKTYKESFNELLTALPGCKWVFSYNDSSWASVEDIKTHIESFNRQVFLHEVDYKYQYRSKEKSSGTEYIIVALPKETNS